VVDACGDLTGLGIDKTLDWYSRVYQNLESGYIHRRKGEAIICSAGAIGNFRKQQSCEILTVLKARIGSGDNEL